MHFDYFSIMEYKLTEEDVKYTISTLEQPESMQMLAIVLGRIKADSEASPLFIAPLKSYLNDERFIMKSVPINYCQVKYLAAYALGSVYHALGMDEIVELKDYIPLHDQETPQLNSLPDYKTLRAIKVPTEISDPTEQVCYKLDQLAASGHFKRTSISIIPRNYSGV